jgi:hypothetical protein
MAAENKRIFSTGILLVGDIDAALTVADNKVGILENITVGLEAKRKDLMAPPAESLYAVDTGFYNAQATLKADVGEFNPDLLTRIAGAVLSNGVYRISSRSKPTFHQVNVIATDSLDEQWTIIVYRALSTSLPFKFGMDDWMKQSIEWEGYPSLTQFNDDGDGLVVDFVRSGA